MMDNNVKYVSGKSSRDDGANVKTLKLEIETLKKRIRTLETNRNVEKAWRKKNNRANFVYGSKHLDQLDLKIMEKRKSLPEYAALRSQFEDKCQGVPLLSFTPRAGRQFLENWRRHNERDKGGLSKEEETEVLDLIRPYRNESSLSSTAEAQIGTEFPAYFKRTSYRRGDRARFESICKKFGRKKLGVSSLGRQFLQMKKDLDMHNNF